MKYGGRYYYRPMHGISPHSIPSSLRRYMLINGEEVCEPDYESLHIRMLYHMFARREEIPEKCYYHKDIPRKHMKIMALIALNAKTEREALFAFKKEVNNNTTKYTYNESKAILEAFKELHKPINDYICSDIGIKLQAKDSKMMKSILSEFTKKDIIVCPIHDSVIIQKKYEDDMIKAMSENYQHEMQVFNWDVKIDTK